MNSPVSGVGGPLPGRSWRPPRPDAPAAQGGQCQVSPIGHVEAADGEEVQHARRAEALPPETLCAATRKCTLSLFSSPHK